MPHTDKMSVYCQYLYDLILANRTSLGMPTDADIRNVFYGDQDEIPVTPLVCVEPDTKRRELSGARRVTRNEMRAGVIIYASKITDITANRKDADVLSEAIETLIHANPSFGTPFGTSNDPLLIHSLVESSESGYIKRDNTSIRATRLIVVGTSQSILPPNP